MECNEYFARHRHMILGDLRAGGGPYRAEELTVTAGTRPLADQLRDAFAQIVTSTPRPTPEATAPSRAPRQPPPVAQPTPIDVRAPARVERRTEAHHKEGSLLATARGGFAVITDGRPEPFTPTPASGRAELRTLIELRDAVAATLTAQASSVDDHGYQFAQHRLNRAYDT